MTRPENQRRIAWADVTRIMSLHAMATRQSPEFQRGWHRAIEAVLASIDNPPLPSTDHRIV